MPKLFLFPLLVFLCVWTAMGQAPADDLTRAAVESHLSCKANPNPTKAIAALMKNGFIERQSFDQLDSINYFRSKKPLSVWGFRVVAVLGYAEDSKIYYRGPGTAPPITFGVLVPYTESEVKAKLSSIGGEGFSVDKSPYGELLSGRRLRGKSAALTEITCQNHN